MNVDSSFSNPEELLAHAGWMRELSRELLREPSLADDVVQQACLLALEKAPRDGWKLGPWLHGVVRNLARDANKTEQRRARRETKAADRDPQQPSASELVQQAEMHRRVLDAVLTLEEPYRETMLLRFFRDVPAEEIARREGVPSSTVRSRIQRGLEKLRERLDRDFHGDRRSWCLGLIPLAYSAKGAAAAGITIGAIVVSSKIIAASAAGVVLAGSAAVWILAQGGGQTAKHGLAPSEPRTASTAPTPATTRALEASPLPVSPAESPGAQAKKSEDAKEESSPRSSRERMIPGRVVNSQGMGIPEAIVRVADEKMPSFSDQDGRFMLEVAAEKLESDAPISIRAEAQGYCDATQDWDPRAKELLVTLKSTPRIQGVLRGPDGSQLRTIGHVRAAFHRIGSAEMQSLSEDTNDDGSFSLLVEPGMLLSLEGKARGFANSKIAPGLSLEPDNVVTLDLPLSEGVEIRGRVINALTGEPIAGAFVCPNFFTQCETDEFSTTAQSDAEGRFVLRGIDPPTPSQHGRNPAESALLRTVSFFVRAEAPGFRTKPFPESMHSVPFNSSGKYNLDIKLYPVGGILVGEVVFEGDNKPASDVEVWAIDAFSESHSAITDESGRFRFEDLPEGLLGIWLNASLDSIKKAGLDAGREDERSFSAAVDVPILAQHKPNTTRVVLSAGKAQASGHTVDVNGAPLEGVRVELSPRITRNGLCIGFSGNVLETDEKGGFHFSKVPIGSYALIVRSDEYVAEPADVSFDLEGNTEATRDVRFVLHRGALFQGKLAGRSDYSQITIELFDLESKNEQALDHARPGVDGSFAFRLVKMGKYRIRVYDDRQALADQEVGPGSDKNLLLILKN